MTAQQSGGIDELPNQAQPAQNGIDKEQTAVPIKTTTATEDSTSTEYSAIADLDGETNDLGDAERCDEPEAEEAPRGRTNRRIVYKRALTYVVLPGLALLLTLAAAFLKWQDSNTRDAAAAAIESVQAARDSTVALLSYRSDTVEKDLGAARDRLTGDFKGAYTSLTDDVVIPGAKQKQITAVATVPAAASVSATPDHAVALVFVNQSTVVGSGAPTGTASSVQVTLDKINGRWLISGFDPR